MFLKGALCAVKLNTGSEAESGCISWPWSWLPGHKDHARHWSFPDGDSYIRTASVASQTVRHGVQSTYSNGQRAWYKYVNLVVGISCVWPVVVMVWASDSWLRGHSFDSRPFFFQVTTFGMLFTHAYTSVTKQYKLVQVKGWWYPVVGKEFFGHTVYYQLCAITTNFFVS